MNKKLYIYSALIFSIFIIYSIAFAESKKSAASPIAFFPENNFVFNNVVEGTQIIHDFKILNKGTAPLFVQKVKSG